MDIIEHYFLRSTGIILIFRNWSSMVNNCMLQYVLNMPPCSKLGAVIGTYGTPQYIDVQLKSLRKVQGDIPILVIDDHSPQWEEVAILSRKHKAEFIVNEARLNHWAGDLNVFRKGLIWAKENNIDLLLKLSRRRIVYKSIVQELLNLANQTYKLGISFYSNPAYLRCDVWPENIWCDTSLMALKVEPWTIALSKIKEKIQQTHGRKLVVMERYMSNLGNWVHEQTYGEKITHPFAHWDNMIYTSVFKGQFETVHSISRALGLDYELSDFDPDSDDIILQIDEWPIDYWFVTDESYSID